MFQIDISDRLVYEDPSLALIPEITHYWPPSKYYSLDIGEDIYITCNQDIFLTSKVDGNGGINHSGQ